jgi:hypothetical protein
MGRLVRSACSLLLASGLLFGLGGCTRHFYRKAADKEVAEVLAEKDQYQAWKLDEYHVYPDPHARFADPTCPDRPPMPPDDPAAFEQAPHPQHPGHAGIALAEGTGYLDVLAKWDAQNRAADPKSQEAVAAAVATTIAEDAAAPGPASGPASAEKAPEAKPQATADKALPDVKPPTARAFRLKLEQAVQLALFNSREYQDRREDLYLAALPVTLQRFAFAAQFYVTEEAIRQVSGRDTPPGKTNNWQSNSNVGFAKLFSTGALLLFNIANTTVIEFTKPKHVLSESTMSLDVVQPLLRGGGRAVTLEPLTQTERNLLYVLRQFARFRKEFFVSIAGGGGGSITGGNFVPTGVLAATGVSVPLGGSGLFPGLVPAVASLANRLNNTPGQSGTLTVSDSIPAPVSGYLGTMLQFVQIDIDNKNIANLTGFLRLFEAMKEGGDVTQLQVDTVEQQLLSGRSTLLTDEQQYGNQIDQLKLQLGLPTDIPLELDLSALNPVLRQFRRFEAVFSEFDAASRAATSYGITRPVGKFRDELRRLFGEAAIVQGTRFRTDFPARWASWENLSTKEARARLGRLAEERRKLLDLKTSLETDGKSLGQPEQQRLNEIDFATDLGNLELALRDYEAQLWKNETDPARRTQIQTTMFRLVVNAFIVVMGEARAERLNQARQSWPSVPRLMVEGVNLLNVEEERAFTISGRQALANRLDLMNVRSQMVDSWRQIAIFANALLGTFNVEYQLNTFTPFGQAKPLDFGGSRTQHQLIINAAPPLVRKAERNNYRASLIAFQKERRNLMEAEDVAVQIVRGEIRQLHVAAENVKIQQRQVELAYLTVESSLDTFRQPPQPASAGGGGTNVAVTAASLTTQLLNAQTRLPLAQNALLTQWVLYLNTRMQLYRDMELMPLDSRGVWIDETTDAAPAADRCSASSDGGGDAGAERENGEPERLPEPRPDAPPAGEAQEESH